jgi:CheY-like chemotaxis protein
VYLLADRLGLAFTQVYDALLSLEWRGLVRHQRTTAVDRAMWGRICGPGGTDVRSGAVSTGRPGWYAPATSLRLLAPGEPRMARIIVVDDNRAIADMLAVVLSDQGYTVQCAYDGEAALALIQGQPPDLLILDLMLPLLSGWQVLDAVRADPACQALPVIVLSVLLVPRAALPAGTVYLPKPVNLPQLEITIQQLLGLS